MSAFLSGTTKKRTSSLQSGNCSVFYLLIMYLFTAGVFVCEGITKRSFRAISLFILALELVTFPLFFLLCGTCSNGSAKNLSSKGLMYDNYEWCKKPTQPFFLPASEYRQKKVKFEEMFLFVCESTPYNVWGHIDYTTWDKSKFSLSDFSLPLIFYITEVCFFFLCQIKVE